MESLEYLAKDTPDLKLEAVIQTTAEEVYTSEKLPVTEQRLVLIRTHWSDRSTIVAVVAAAAHVVAVRIEVEVPRAVRVVGVERTRPVGAAAAYAVETAIVAVASSGKEETVAVAGGEESAVHAVLCCPGYICVVVEFFEFFSSRHTPAVAPVGRGSIVLRQQSCQIVGKAVVTIEGVVAILG